MLQTEVCFQGKKKNKSFGTVIRIEIYFEGEKKGKIECWNTISNYGGVGSNTSIEHTTGLVPKRT